MRHRKISLVTNSENVCLPNDSRYLVESLVHEHIYPAYYESVFSGRGVPTVPFPFLKRIPWQMMALLCKADTFSRARL